MKIRSQPVGAVVEDVDLTALSDADFVALERAWCDHGALFVRDQELTPDDHIAFAERFAPIEVNRYFQQLDSHPQIAQVLKEPDQERNIGGGWHTDHTYDQVPARGSILVARDLPPTGGDTRFADVARAYDALSDGLKATLESLEAQHSNDHVFGKDSEYTKESGGRLTSSEGPGNAVHPVVIAHPSTGRKLLYVNPAFTIGFVGWTTEESASLLSYLYNHISGDEFTTQFAWEPGTVAMWDNRSTWHWALNDYPGHRRLMHRITVRGEPLSAAI